MPLQIIIYNDPDQGQRTITVRVYVVIVLFASLLISAGMIGHAFFPSTQRIALDQQITQLQQKQDELTGKLAKTEAMLSLGKGQIDGLKQEMSLLGSENSIMKKRLAMFEDVLAARKVSGIHFLRPMATWQDNNTITYQLSLVKGENYPRWIKGHLSFSVTGADGQVITLSAKKGKRSLKVEMKTHAFMEGTLAWPQTWQPDRLTITLIDHLGRQKGKIEIPIFSSSSQPPLNLTVPNQQTREPSP
ncbi:MAG: hypothetical protein Q9M12_06985 [Mariprofundus sp.]|nr:hypothetical protein [Mariprofundus sp.]